MSLRRAHPERDGEAGFTVIEAVVALALLAVMLAAIGTVMASNSRSARILEQHVALTETARLIASGLPREGTPFSNTFAGQVSGHRWQMRLSPFLGVVPPVSDSRFIPQRVELRVRSPSGAIVSFETVRLQARGAQQ